MKAIILISIFENQYGKDKKTGQNEWFLQFVPNATLLEVNLI